MITVDFINSLEEGSIVKHFSGDIYKVISIIGYGSDVTKYLRWNLMRLKDKEIFRFDLQDMKYNFTHFTEEELKVIKILYGES